MILSGTHATELMLRSLTYVQLSGSLIGKAWDTLDLTLTLSTPSSCFTFQRKQYWIWALQELSDRLNPHVENPGFAYRFRPNWAKKLAKEQGTFVYTYGEIYKKQLPVVLKALKSKSSREAIISVWNEDSLLNNQVHGKRTPCTLHHHFLIRNSHVYLFTSMRTSDSVNLLCYDILHHSLLQSYVAASLGLGMGDLVLRLDHCYYQKKRQYNGNIDRIIDELKGNTRQNSPLFGFSSEHLQEDMKVHYQATATARGGNFSESIQLSESIVSLFVKEFTLSLVVAEANLRGHSLKISFELPEFQFINKT